MNAEKGWYLLKEKEACKLCVSVNMAMIRHCQPLTQYLASNREPTKQV
jgi:hypothetical protein